MTNAAITITTAAHKMAVGDGVVESATITNPINSQHTVGLVWAPVTINIPLTADNQHLASLINEQLDAQLRSGLSAKCSLELLGLDTDYSGTLEGCWIQSANWLHEEQLTVEIRADHWRQRKFTHP
jgi:hypothetical protein